MRTAIRTVVVLVGTVLTAASSLCQQTSTVITPQASVHSQASTKSRVLRTLESGQPVIVEMTINNSEGTWCLVREVDTKEKAGYIPCAQITSDALPKPVPTVPVFDSPASSSTSDTNGGENPAVSNEQKTSYQQMLEGSGLEALRADLAATLRRHGVTDSASFLDRMIVAGHNPYGDSFVMQAEPKVRRGGVVYKAFWKKYWSSLTPEQVNWIAKHNPNMLLWYMQSQSEPESAFLGWVLGSMQQGKRK